MRKLVSLVVIFILAGCVTTGPKPPEKWETDRRVKAHVDLGMNYLRRGQTDPAQDEFELALQISPRSDIAAHAMGLLQSRLGENEQARTWFSRAVSINPQNFTAVNDLGIHLCQNGEPQQGIDRLKRILDVPENTGLIVTNLGLGICYQRLNRYQQAKQYLRTALTASPNLPQALLPLAEISKQEKKYLQARAFLERYFSGGSISAKALFLGVQVEVALKDIDRAQIYARELRAQYPKSPDLPKLKSLL